MTPNSRATVTDPCPRCGHQIIAHSAVDGCTFCECEEKHVMPRETLGAGDYRNLAGQTVHDGDCVVPVEPEKT